MTKNVYNELLEAMKKRGGGYAGMDIPEFYALAEALFTPEQARTNNAMPKGPFQAKDLAVEMEWDETETAAILETMADSGLCMALKVGDIQFYQSARFMPGIFEFQFMSGEISDRSRQIAGLIHQYKKAFDENSKAPASEFPSCRVIPVNRTIQAGSRVHTHDQVQFYVENNEHISVTTCYCRHAALLRGEEIHDMPTDVCMQFGMAAQFAIERLGARQVTKAEALEVLKSSEEAGLIHMSDNVTDNLGFLCNCDRWHCVVVTKALSKPKPGLFFNSGFEPYFDPDSCEACGTCVDRCPPEALSMGDDDLPKMDLDRCFGCAVCATGCPNDAITMTNKPDYPIPPKNHKELKAAIKTGLG